MKTKNILIIILIITTLLLSGCVDKDKSDCGYNEKPSCRFGCYDNIACGELIEYEKRSNEMAFRCTDEVDDYIIKNNLSCDMGSIRSDNANIPICCRSCVFTNEFGNDIKKDVCKANKQ